MKDKKDITVLLKAWSEGCAQAGEALVPLVYEELHRRAKQFFRQEKPDHTLQPTALVNEAFVHLIGAEISWQDRAHFIAVAARMMRRLLINHANARAAGKRGGNAIRVTFDESQYVLADNNADLLDLDMALTALGDMDPRKAELIDLHYFGGLTVLEMQEVTGLSTATIGRHLRFARAWLLDELTNEP